MQIWSFEIEGLLLQRCKEVNSDDGMEDTQVYSPNSLTKGALGKCGLKVLRNLFGPLLAYTTRRTLDLRQLGHSSKEIEAQIRSEKEYSKERDVRVEDRNLRLFNTFQNVCYRQTLADASLPEQDIDELIVKYFLGGVEGSRIRRRARDLMRTTKDPRKAYSYYVLEKMESHRR